VRQEEGRKEKGRRREGGGEEYIKGTITVLPLALTIFETGREFGESN
jgi:hypothetical protein